MLTTIPCLLMRGGTSKGPYFLASDLPEDPKLRDQTLLAVMGSPDSRQINGLGGGDTLTSKVAIVSASSRAGADVDYLFAQVSVSEAIVDTGPNCGNMLAGVGPFAIEKGLVAARSPVTKVRIFNVNTNKMIEAIVQTPDGRVQYEGDARIDGVPGTGAPIVLNFLDAGGSKTGKLLPTGNVVDVIDGVEVSCVDYSTPVMFMAAADFGKTGYETKKELDADAGMLAKIEAIRQKAGKLMGLGDVTGKVLPKVILVAPPKDDGNVTSRYFVPWNCHAAHAVTGALCMAAACHIEGSVARKMARLDPQDPTKVVIEHPTGSIEARVVVGATAPGQPAVIESAGIVRTARPLMSGLVYVEARAAQAESAGSQALAA